MPRAERSYFKDSRFEVMAMLYSLMAASFEQSLSWVSSRNITVRLAIMWSRDGLGLVVGRLVK